MECGSPRVFSLLAILGALMGHCLAGTRELPPGAEEAASRFVRALVARDRQLFEAVSPKDPARLFGPCPFGEHSRMLRPRVDGDRAEVETEWTADDTGRRMHGVYGLVKCGLCKETEAVAQASGMDRGSPPDKPPGVRAADRSPRWLVKSFIVINGENKQGNLPHSRTAADKASEPAVASTVARYTRAWLRQPSPDYATMLHLRNGPWPPSPRSAPRFRVLKLELEPLGNTGGEERVAFKMKLRTMAVVTRWVAGELALVCEDGVWKARLCSLNP